MGQWGQQNGPRSCVNNYREPGPHSANSEGGVTLMVEQTAPKDTPNADDDLFWQTGCYGSDLEWFTLTGHCGHCGSEPDWCTCPPEDPCGCGPHYADGSVR